jgi:LEA14-like dessication related protein
MKPFAGIFSAIALCALVLQSCSKPKALEYRDLKGARIHNATLQQATVVLDLLFYNPNNYGLRLKNGDVDAYLNGKLAGKATLDESVSVPARDTFTMPVTITASLGSLLSNAMSLLTKQEQLIPVKLEGMIRAGKGGVFVPVKVHYEGMQKLQL